MRYESYKDQKREQKKLARDKPGAGRNITKVHMECQGLSPSKWRTRWAASILIGWCPCCSSYKLQGALNLWNLFMDPRR